MLEPNNPTFEGARYARAQLSPSWQGQTESFPPFTILYVVPVLEAVLKDEDPETIARYRRLAKRGIFPVVGYSTMEPDGEHGDMDSNHPSWRWISRDEFEATARELGIA